MDTLRRRVDAAGALTAEQAAKLDEGLAYMKDALGRLGRFDWRNVAVTTLITKASEIGIPAIGNLLVRMASHIIGSGGHEVHVLPPGDSTV
jgi:hypothetical protein